jgi:hypothetical protein
MTSETLISITIGIGLAAACGFRVFVPLLILSAAALGGYVPLASGFEWIGTIPALVAFATATLLEILAYKVPWLDHALDTLATPAAIAAGILATASVVADLPPLVRWAVALVGGGGAAGAVQGATVLARLKSGLSTGGLANPLVAAVELAGAVVTALLALMLPLAGLAIAAAAGLGLGLWVFRRAGRRGHHPQSGGER